jgi:hypothetical protein
MNSNMFYSVIVLGLSILLYVIYLNKTEEGFSQNITISHIPKKIEDNSTILNDTLLISKYRTDYEDTIINLHNQMGLAILKEIINNVQVISNNPTSKKSLKIISQINELEKFKSTLNETIDILDKN